MGLSSLFFKEDKPKAETKGKPQMSTPVPAPARISPIGGTVVDNEFKDYFTNLLKECNIPGPDYFEFSKAIDALNGQPLTEQQKYVSVFSSFATMDVTKAKLLETADIYLKKIAAEKIDFAKELQDNTTKEIGGREAKVSELTAKNQELTEQIQKNNVEISKLKGEINETNVQLSNSAAGFEQASQVALDTINNRIINIQNYL